MTDYKSFNAPVQFPQMNIEHIPTTCKLHSFNILHISAHVFKRVQMC